MRGVVRALGRGLSIVTPTGWALLTLVALSVVVGLVLQWSEAATITAASLVVIVVAAVRVAWRPPHIVAIDITNEHIVAGQSTVGQLTVTNGSARSARTGIIEVPIGAGLGEFVVPPLRARGKWEDIFLVGSKRRGVIEVGPARSVRTDPLGLVRRVREWGEPVVLHVHPRTVRVPFDATGFQVDIEGVVTAKLSSSDVSFHALRDYEPGDDQRSVHWASSARLGKLIVRQYEETHRSHHLVILDNTEGSWDQDPFETAVSAVASLGLANLRESRTVSLATASEWIPTTSAMRMLDALAELGTAPRGDFLRRVREVIDDRPGASAVTIVVPASTTDEQAAHLSRLTPVDVPVSIVRIDPSAARGRSAMGGGVLLDCPTLKDLPRLIIAGGLT